MRVGMCLILSGFLVVGCGDDDNGSGTNADAGADVQTTADGQQSADLGEVTANFKNDLAYTGFQGSASIETEVSVAVIKVELLVNGQVAATAQSAPFTLEWDTTTSADGVVQLSIKAYGQDTSITSEEIPVVIYNNGQEAGWIDGNSSSMTIQPDIDNHIKHHWEMPVGIKKVVGILAWDNAEFKMKFDIGTGNCPHSGTTAAFIESDTSPVILEFDAGGALTTGQWFAHTGAINEADLGGKTTQVSFDVFLLQ